MTVLNAVIEETLAACREPVTADELFQSCAADGIPVTYHQCKVIAKLSVECITKGGWYNILQLAGGGNVINFFNQEGDVTENIRLRAPDISRDRKIPKLNWMRDLFAQIGYDSDRIEIKYIHRIIESHIRDGGTWTPACNDRTIVFILKMNGSVKSHHEFHREDVNG